MTDRNGRVVTTLSAREFKQDTNRAKKAARNGPVYIATRGRPTHVLLTFGEYCRLAEPRLGSQTLADALAMPGAEDIEFDPPRLGGRS